ncbi:hypothetical protein D4764_07G0006950 [Takifugu flavidus]|uniref:Uncharacterized protein n=1 Tax=Takifugu flavidus TaxID=433684 RepID=A0A5C6MSC9_9TELE|nr:hypothetical protein D4764_07G0006950 [Takifugu flavidus]
MQRLVPDLRSGLSDPEPRTWSEVGGAVLSPGAEADTFSGIPLRGDSEARRTALSPFRHQALTWNAPFGGSS